MKKRFIPLLALLLSLCIIVPVSIAQIMAAEAVQISVTATGGSVEIDGHTVAGGGNHSVEENATVSIKAVPQDGYVFDCWSVTGRSIAAEDLKKNPATLSVTTGAVALTAKFQKTLTVTLNQAEGGKATITPTDKAVGHTETTVTGLDDSSGNMVATLTATANDGYAFSEWEVTYVKANGSSADAFTQEEKAIRYQYVRSGSKTGTSIDVGFCNDTSVMGLKFNHVSIIVTPKFTKQLDVTIAESDGGTVTSSDTLTSLASGASVKLTATPNEGYGVLGWNVTDKDGNATSDYTLKMANDTATITLGNTSLKVSAQFSADAGKFVVDPTEKKPPTATLRNGVDSIQNGITVVSGWNNNKNEELVMTIVPTQDPRTIANANLYMAIWKFAASGYAEGATLGFSADVEVSDSSSANYKNITFKSDCAHPWEEIPFTITDVNSNVKQAKIVLDYPSKGTVSIEGTGKVTVNGSEYANGDVVKAVTGAELKLQATEASTFAGWEVSGTNITLTEEQTKANPLTITAPEGSFTIKAKFQTGDSDNVTVQVKLMEGINDRSSDKFWAEGVFVSDMAVFTFTVNGQSVPSGKEILKKGDVCQFTVTPADPERYVLKEIAVCRVETEMERQFFVTTNASGSFIVDEWYYSYSLRVTLEEKTEDNARHDITLTQVTGGTITSSNSTAQPNTTVTLTAVPDSGYTLKSWIVKDEQQKVISVTTDKTDRNVGTFTMPKSNVTVTAEFESTSEITPTITSVALVKSADGSLVAKGAPSGDNWTITIPNTVSAETVAKIPEGLSGLNLKIVTPAGVKVKQEGGGGSYEGDWSNGDISCYMPVGEEVMFKATAGTATKDYTIKLIYSGSGEPTEPILSNGSATRISNSGAAVQFSSNVAGNYFYKVVNHSAAAPTVEEILASSNKGTASTGVNNITLSNLGDGARDIYIVVVDASNNRSVVLKIEIPAYGSIDVPDTGAYTITVKAPKGGTITPNRTKANAGDEIIVTVTPDSGYQMVADSLTYTLAVAGGETVKITNNRFTMPEGNVSISCQWETAATTSTGITGFSINGVAGAVNNTTNTITITMPRGTDVTKLTPVIATNGVKSLTPGSGETVDFTNAVTYTAAMEDGSSKTYTVTVYVDKGTLADQFWDKLTDFATQVPWWQYAEKQQSTSKYPKYW